MIECRKRIDLDAIPVPPEQPGTPPCLHFIAAWGGPLGEIAESVLWGLKGNRELAIRNVRPADVLPSDFEANRAMFDAAAAEYAHEVTNGEPGSSEFRGALFGDVFERDRVSFAFAQIILGPDPMSGR